MANGEWRMATRKWRIVRRTRATRVPSGRSKGSHEAHGNRSAVPEPRRVPGAPWARAQQVVP